jgi:hypothetical protein
VLTRKTLGVLAALEAVTTKPALSVFVVPVLALAAGSTHAYGMLTLHVAVDPLIVAEEAADSSHTASPEAKVVGFTVAEKTSRLSAHPIVDFAGNAVTSFIVIVNVIVPVVAGVVEASGCAIGVAATNVPVFGSI